MAIFQCRARKNHKAVTTFCRFGATLVLWQLLQWVAIALPGCVGRVQNISDHLLRCRVGLAIE